MPTYEYVCPEGHEFEKFQKMSDPPEARCPECGRDGERQLSGGAGLVFKGEGFYITDYRSDEYRRKANAEGKPGKKESDGGSGSTSDGSGGASSTESGGEG